MNNEEFWNRVKILIKRRGWTQRQFSESIGLQATSIERYMNRNTLPDVELGCKIAAKLEVPLECLVTGKAPINNIDQKKEELLSEVGKLQKLINQL